MTSPAERPPQSHGRHAPARFFSRARSLVLALVVGLFLSSVMVGRMLAPALPGWKAGIERWILRADWASAVLGQLVVVAGCLMTIQLLIATLRESNLGIGYRLAVAPLSAGIVTLILAAATRELPILLTVTLSVLVSLLVAAASIPTLLASHTRAAGFVLGLAAVSSFVTIVARVLALRASDEALASLFQAARVLATVVLVIDVATLVVGALWLAARRWVGLAVASALAVGSSAVLAWLALGGSSYGAASWQVLAGRAVAELVRHPRPLVPRVIHSTVELLALALVLASLVLRRDRAFCASAIGLAVLCRGATDLPVLALAATVAGLLGPLAAARELPPLSAGANTRAAGSPSTPPQTAPTPTTESTTAAPSLTAR